MYTLTICNVLDLNGHNNTKETDLGPKSTLDVEVPLTNPDSGLVLDSVQVTVAVVLLLVSCLCKALAELSVFRECVEPLKSSIISEPAQVKLKLAYTPFKLIMKNTEKNHN